RLYKMLPTHTQAAKESSRGQKRSWSEVTGASNSRVATGKRRRRYQIIVLICRKHARPYAATKAEASRRQTNSKKTLKLANNMLLVNCTIAVLRAIRSAVISSVK